jgi:hypothetical protein
MDANDVDTVRRNASDPSRADVVGELDPGRGSWRPNTRTPPFHEPPHRLEGYQLDLLNPSSTSVDRPIQRSARGAAALAAHAPHPVAEAGDARRGGLDVVVSAGRQRS